MPYLRRCGALFERLSGGAAPRSPPGEGIASQRGRAPLYGRVLPAALLVIVAGAPALAGDGAGSAAPQTFMSLRSDRINLRVGPGKTYPILWVLTRKGMPVEVLRNFDDWRMIRDPDGDKGWVQRSMVTDERTVVVTGAVRALHAAPQGASPIRARAEPGVIARLLLCRGAWCEIGASGFSGWVRRSEVWGAGGGNGERESASPAEGAPQAKSCASAARTSSGMSAACQ